MVVPALAALTTGSRRTDAPHEARDGQQEWHRADAAGDVWVKPTWDEVVRDHSGRVYRLAYRLTGNPHDAEDITQEVFVRVFRSLDSYRPGTFEGWLHRITTNLFLDTVRRKQRQRTDALAEDAAERLPGREPGPEREYEFRHLTDDVQAALDALSPEFRAAVVLSDIEGLSYEEIATTLGVKLGHRPVPDPPRPRPAPAGAGAPPPDPRGAMAPVLTGGLA